MTYLRVRNWNKFQHYKQRNPPWIRLYNELLDNYEIGRLQDASKWHAVGIWLLASRFDNRIPEDAAWIGSRIGATEPVDIDALVSAGVLERYDDASNAIAEREQDAKPEGETEVEEEREEEKRQNPLEAGSSAEVSRVPDANGSSPDALLSLVEETARRVFGNPEHVRSFVTAARPIAKGTDTTCWKNGTGESAPEADRPRLFELALNHWEAKPEAERRVLSLRSCVRYVVAQQTDAYALPVAKPHADSQAARHAPKGVSDDLAAARAKRDRERALDSDVEVLDRWAAEHPAISEPVKAECYANAGDDPGKLFVALAAYRKRIRELMEAAA